MQASRGCSLGVAAALIFGCAAGTSGVEEAEADAGQLDAAAPSEVGPPPWADGGSFTAGSGGSASAGGTAPGGGGIGGGAGAQPAGGAAGAAGGASLSPKSPTPGVVQCGAVTCEASQNQVCCIESLVLKYCHQLGCLPTTAPWTCDGPEDCETGKLCVMDLFDGRRPTYCRPEPLNAEVVLCYSGADCPTGTPHCCQFIDRRSCSETPSAVAEGCD